MDVFLFVCLFFSSKKPQKKKEIVSYLKFVRKRQQEWCSRFDTMNLNNGGVAAFPTSLVTTTCDSDIVLLVLCLPCMFCLVGLCAEHHEETVIDSHLAEIKVAANNSFSLRSPPCGIPRMVPLSNVN